MYQEMIIPPLFVQNLNNFRHGKVRGEGYSTNFSRRKYRVCTKKGVSGACPLSPARAIRGGSWWVDDVDACRISCKRCIWPSNNEDNIGFRLAL